MPLQSETAVAACIAHPDRNLSAPTLTISERKNMPNILRPWYGFWVPFPHLENSTPGADKALAERVRERNKAWLRRRIDLYIFRWMFLTGICLASTGYTYFQGMLVLHGVLLFVGAAAAVGLSAMYRLKVLAYR
jgi:hypothetical protein